MQKVYLETTIPSYLTSRPSRDVIIAGRQALTHEWWEKRRSKFLIYVSPYVLNEAAQGDAELAEKRIKLLEPSPVLAENNAIFQSHSF